MLQRREDPDHRARRAHRVRPGPIAGRRQRGLGDRPLQRPGDAREGRGAGRDDAHPRHRRRRLRRPADRLHLPVAHRGRLQRRRLRPRAPGQRRGHRVRARALPHGEGGAGDVDGHRVQAAPRPVARRSARTIRSATRWRRRRRRTRCRRSPRRASARYCARSFDLPVTIARMGAAYSDQSGLPVWHLDAVAAGEPVRTRWDPMPYSPIHDDDICAQLEPLLDVASVPATIVNWGGDEPVSVQEYTRATSASSSASTPRWWSRRSPARRGARSATTTKRSSITGPCRGRLARRVPPRGASTSTRTGSADDRARRDARTAIRQSTRCSAEATRGDRVSPTSGRATSARASTCCSRASSATPI